MSAFEDDDYIEIATGGDADIFAQNCNWGSYEHHVAESKHTSGYYIADLCELSALTEEEIQTAEMVAVTVVCNCGLSFSAEEMQALKINGKLYVIAQEFEENFL